MSVFQREGSGRIIKSKRAIPGATWFFRFKLRGREHYEPVAGAKTRADAERAEAMKKSQRLRDRYGIDESGDMAFGDLVDAYLAWSKGNKKSYGNDFYYSRRLLEAFHRQTPVGSIKPEEIEAFKERMKNETTIRWQNTDGGSYQPLHGSFALCAQFRCEERLAGSEPDGWRQGKAVS
jgi:hypothetical protein